MFENRSLTRIYRIFPACGERAVFRALRVDHDR